MNDKLIPLLGSGADCIEHILSDYLIGRRSGLLLGEPHQNAR
jgi:hypothetical protein